MEQRQYLGRMQQPVRIKPLATMQGLSPVQTPERCLELLRGKSAGRRQDHQEATQQVPSEEQMPAQRAEIHGEERSYLHLFHLRHKHKRDPVL